MNLLKKDEGVPLLNFEGVPGVPLLNFEGDSGIPLLNFEEGLGFRVQGSHFYTMPYDQCMLIRKSVWSKNMYIQKYQWQNVVKRHGIKNLSKLKR